MLSDDADRARLLRVRASAADTKARVHLLDFVASTALPPPPYAAALHSALANIDRALAYLDAAVRALDTEADWHEVIPPEDRP